MHRTSDQSLLVCALRGCVHIIHVSHHCPVKNTPQPSSPMHPRSPASARFPLLQGFDDGAPARSKFQPSVINPAGRSSCEKNEATVRRGGGVGNSSSLRLVCSYNSLWRSSKPRLCHVSNTKTSPAFKTPENDAGC